ncbi:MAG: hypothetical protein IKV39_03035 [Clostridia bacterium]|nr:hypothetical protein [Clostridia bacterium]
MKKILPIIMLVVLLFSLAAFVSAERTVVYATKVDKAPNMEADTPFIDESWGEPAIVINSSSPNTELYKFWYKENPHIGDDYWGSNGAVASLLEPEDNDVELYYLWDSKYLYFGMKTLDSEPSGFVMPYMGDGFQMWLSTFALLNGQEYAQSSYQENELDDLFYANHNNCDYYVTLDTSDWDSHCGAAAAVCDNEVWVDDDGYLYAYVRIPLANIGLNPKADNHGVELATALLRISSRDVMDRGYSGWLAWGKYFYETKVDGMNKIILIDPAQGMPDVETPETEAPVVETEAPETEVPETEAPETEAPETEAPETDAPETEAPETEAPVVETEAPETEAPETEAPETEAPETSAPTTPAEPAAEKNNTGLIIGIVAAVVVVGAVVGIVLGKKKK